MGLKRKWAYRRTWSCISINAIFTDADTTIKGLNVAFDIEEGLQSTRANQTGKVPGDTHVTFLDLLYKGGEV
jgi:hypothetical protein